MINYSSCFTQYADNTNGKKLLSAKLKEYLSNYIGGDLLDVGAGDGQITASLAPSFSKVVAVEPKPELASLIPNERNINVIQDKIENYISRKGYDVILMSYFLDSFTTEDIHFILRKLRLLKKSSGIMIGATYSSNCEWDQFTERVASDLGIKRKGGYERVHLKITAYEEFTCRIVDEVKSYIWGDNIQNLYDNLSFFFKSNIQEYHKRQKIYMEWLEEYCIYEQGKCCIEVIENIYEIN